VWLFSDNGHQYVNTDRHPDLNLDAILGDPVKRFDTKVGFDLFEEDFEIASCPGHKNAEDWWIT